MLSERLEQWAEAYKAEGEQRGLEKGMQQGMQQAVVLTLQRQLTRRFGPIPADITARIAAAPLETIEIWLDRILDAESLGEIFQ
jgi:flagellar biosynthesis/type III secretory pathway protein FliH